MADDESKGSSPSTEDGGGESSEAGSPVESMEADSQCILGESIMEADSTENSSGGGARSRPRRLSNDPLAEAGPSQSPMKMKQLLSSSPPKRQSVSQDEVQNCPALVRILTSPTEMEKREIEKMEMMEKIKREKMELMEKIKREKMEREKKEMEMRNRDRDSQCSSSTSSSTSLGQVSSSAGASGSNSPMDSEPYSKFPVLPTKDQPDPAGASSLENRGDREPSVASTVDSSIEDIPDDDIPPDVDQPRLKKKSTPKKKLKRIHKR